VWERGFCLLRNLQTCCGAHPPSSSMGTGDFSEVKQLRCEVDSSPLSSVRLRMRETTPLLPSYALMVCKVTLLFTAMLSWKPLRPSEQRTLWFISAKRRWMISLSGMRWAFFGSPDMLEYGVMKSQMGSRGAALLWGFSDPSRPWGSLGEIYKWGSVAG